MSHFSNKHDLKRTKMVIKIDSIVDTMSISRHIEQSIYNYIIKLSKEKNIHRNWNNTVFAKLYNSKIISIYSNLQKDSYIHNRSFLERIKSMEINPKEVGDLSVYDINPDNWKELLNVKSKRDKIKYELKPEAMTNLFKCNRCGSRETSYYEVQTRSADEPMTQFITCLQCNSRWKQ
jgi:DNA-directed RNA polymerase subunit M/transcription elongation factor TFIIS